MALNPTGRGGKRPGAGRPEGSKNKVTIELREAAQAYTQDALKTLHEVCLKGLSEAARVAAACALLDRGHGKPRQALDVATDRVNYVVGIDRSTFEDETEFERELAALAEQRQDGATRRAFPRDTRGLER